MITGTIFLVKQERYDHKCPWQLRYVHRYLNWWIQIFIVVFRGFVKQSTVSSNKTTYLLQIANYLCGVISKNNNECSILITFLDPARKTTFRLQAENHMGFCISWKIKEFWEQWNYKMAWPSYTPKFTVIPRQKQTEKQDITVGLTVYGRSWWW